MTTDNTEQFLAQLRTEADAAHFPDLTERAIARASRPALIDRLRTRAAAIAATVVVTLGGFGGVAYAANGAAPGDLLYGLDRALEALGIGNGGSAERLAEVRSLVDEGHADLGVEHAADLVTEASHEEAEEAHDALMGAADRIRQHDGSEAPEGVVDLLTYLSENLGALDGSTVAGLAQAIAGNAASGPPDGVPPNGAPDDPPPVTTPPTVPTTTPPTVPTTTPPTTIPVTTP